MSGRARTALQAAVVVVVALATYANSLANAFAFDDVSIILDNARVHQLANLSLILDRPYWPAFGSMLGLYRPLTTLLFALQWHAWGDAALGFHAVNLLLHATVAVLVLFYLRRLTGSSGAFLGALVFAVHPVHTEAVANIVGQAELLAGVGMLAACLVHASRPAGPDVSWPRRLGLVAGFGVALLAKESAIVLPALLVLGDFVQGRVPLERAALRRYLRGMALPLFLLAAVAAAYLFVRLGVLGAIAGTDAGPSLPFLRGQHRLLVAFRAWPEYVRLLFFPQDLSADYSPAVVLPVTSMTPMALLGLGLLALTVFTAALLPFRPAVAFPAAWLLVTILPVSNLLFPIGVVVAERTLYIPSLAVCALAAFGWEALAARARRRGLRLAAAGAVAILAVMAARSYRRNPDWADTAAVIRSIARDHPESYRAHWAAATTAAARGRPEIAEAHWQVAYRLWPGSSELIFEWGTFELSRRNYARAVGLLETSYRLHPFVPQFVDGLAYAYVKVERPADARRLIDEAFRLDGPTPRRFMTLAEADEQLGQFSSAAAAWRAAMRRDTPPTWVEWAHLARALERSGDAGAAAAAFATARRRAPADQRARATLDALDPLTRGACLDTTASSTAPEPGPSAGTLRSRSGGPVGVAACPDPLAAWEVLPVTLPQNANSSRIAPHAGP